MLVVVVVDAVNCRVLVVGRAFCVSRLYVMDMMPMDSVRVRVPGDRRPVIVMRDVMMMSRQVFVNLNRQD